MFKTNHKKTTTSAAKQPRYIYTEADLGEGILDEGVRITYNTTKRQNKTVTTGLSVKTTIRAKRNNSIKIPNVAEDFSYAYYGY